MMLIIDTNILYTGDSIDEEGDVGHHKVDSNLETGMKSYCPFCCLII